MIPTANLVSYINLVQDYLPCLIRLFSDRPVLSKGYLSFKDKCINVQELDDKTESDDSSSKKHVTTMLTDILNTSNIISAPDYSNVDLRDNIKKEKFSSTSLYNASESFTYMSRPCEDCSGDISYNFFQFSFNVLNLQMVKCRLYLISGKKLHTLHQKVCLSDIWNCSMIPFQHALIYTRIILMI